MTILVMAVMTTALLLIITGIYMLIRSSNMLRIILAAEVLMKAVMLLFIFAGQVNGNMALAESYLVSMIVVEVISLIAAVGIVISIYHKTGSMDISILQSSDLPAEAPVKEFERTEEENHE